MKRVILILLMLTGLVQAQITRVAHRGGRSLAPENTLTALKAGMAFEVDFIEIDVHQTRDSVVILHHDETVDRCTNGSGRIDQLSFAEISKLDAGSWYSSEFEGEKVPTLDEALALVKGKCGLWIEVKGGAADYKGIENRIVELIQKHEAHNWVQVISFDSQALQKIHELDDRIVLQKLLVSNLGFLPFYMDKGLRWGSPRKFNDLVSGYGFYHKSISRSLVKRVHRWGKKCNAWTVNEAEKVEKLKNAGIDGITTDQPALITVPR